MMRPTTHHPHRLLGQHRHLCESKCRTDCVASAVTGTPRNSKPSATKPLRPPLLPLPPTSPPTHGHWHHQRLRPPAPPHHWHHQRLRPLRPHQARRSTAAPSGVSLALPASPSRWPVRRRHRDSTAHSGFQSEAGSSTDIMEGPTAGEHAKVQECSTAVAGSATLTPEGRDLIPSRVGNGASLQHLRAAGFNPDRVPTGTGRMHRRDLGRLGTWTGEACLLARGAEPPVSPDPATEGGAVTLLDATRSPTVNGTSEHSLTIAARPRRPEYSAHNTGRLATIPTLAPPGTHCCDFGSFLGTTPERQIADGVLCMDCDGATGRGNRNLVCWMSFPGDPQAFQKIVPARGTVAVAVSAASQLVRLCWTPQ